MPYRLTDTNHFLVRVRLNGKGPFNFLVDSGAPTLYIATETAKKVGLKPDPAEFWTPVDRLDLEGGARLEAIKARVEDPFQLVGMNALGLPGASIDGILGFTILARFRLEIDLTQDRMIWTRLAHEPRDPPVPKRRPGEKPAVPAGIQAMSTLGTFAKGLAFVLGKQPEEEQRLHGFLGLEWVEQKSAGRTEVEITRVLTGSPAANGGIRARRSNPEDQSSRDRKRDRRPARRSRWRSRATRWPWSSSAARAKTVTTWCFHSSPGMDFNKWICDQTLGGRAQATHAGGPRS